MRITELAKTDRFWHARTIFGICQDPCETALLYSTLVDSRDRVVSWSMPGRRNQIVWLVR